ncbi:ribonuclease E/G [Paenibacillus sp. P22]|uniref:ribonuclease E/G n=1 Tax=Paenibacillus sp. P22 TaxID=483908 RepID=UPI0004312F84|nr:hypothetical protein BN871_AK_00170 [Paenibacillus sp. P22]
MDRKREDSRNPAEQPSWIYKWKQSPVIRTGLCILFVLLFYFNLSPHLVPETYNITLDQASDRDIVASKTVEDKIATKRAQEQAAESVEPISSSLPLKPDSILNRVFNRIELLNQDEGVTESNKIDIYRSEIPSYYSEYLDEFSRLNQGKPGISDTLLEEMAKAAKAQAYAVPAEVFYKLPSLTSAQIAEMRQVGVTVVRKLSADPIREAETARAKVAELVNASSLTQRTTREIVQELARMSLMPNKFPDNAATEEARNLARENTTPVMIKEGGIIVKKGEVVGKEKYDMLAGAGMLGGQRTYWPQLGLLLASVLFVLMIMVYLQQSGSISGVKPRYNNMHLFMLWLINLLNLALMQAAGLTQSASMPYAAYIAPAAVGTMLITLLLDKQLAIVSSFLFAIMGSVIFNADQNTLFDFRYGFVISVVSFSAIFSVHRASQRSTILKAGIMASLFGTVSVLAILLLGDLPERKDILYSLGFAFGSGLVTAVLVIGLMPFFELTFGILSALKLVEQHGIAEQLSAAFQTRIWLPSGGYLVWEQTEALTVIDVNTGKFTGTSGLEDTVFRTNMEAAREIARLLRLRDVGGIIIVDFIDMEDGIHREKVRHQLEDASRDDRSKCQVHGWTRLGLLEITRKKTRKSIGPKFHEICGSCGGSGQRYVGLSPRAKGGQDGRAST